MGKDLNGKELGKGIMQRQDGCYTYRYMFKGKRREERFQNKTQAKERKKEVEYWIKHDANNVTSKLTLNEWYEYWITYYKIGYVKESTINNISNFYKLYIRDYFKDCYISSIDSAMCVKWIKELYDKGYKYGTVSTMTALLSSMLGAAVNESRISKNPMIAIRKSPTMKQDTERVVLNTKQQALFLEYAKSKSLYNLFVVGFETGLRNGELLGLCMADIDFDKCTLTVHRQMARGKRYEAKFTSPKTLNSKRVVPLTSKAIEALKLQIEIARIRNKPGEYEDLVFTSTNGKPLSRNDINISMARVESAIKKDGYTDFPHVHAHTMRHTFATNCVKNGVEPKALQLILGHADIRTTLDIYTHPDIDYLQSEMQKLNGYQDNKIVYLSKNTKCIKRKAE